MCVTDQWEISDLLSQVKCDESLKSSLKLSQALRRWPLVCYCLFSKNHEEPASN